MKINCIQHVPFENPGNIESWANEKNHAITMTKVYENFQFPDLNTFDLLIVLGGPMNIYEENKYNWLKEEKEFIKNAINSKKYILGICLGAQLLADVLGSNVIKNQYKEIGWYPILMSKEAKINILFQNIPDSINVFHWHGDTFDMPVDSIPVASSNACSNQGFVHQDRVVGLQFHLESSESSIKNLIKNCEDEIVNAKYIQSKAEMLNSDKIDGLEKNLYKFLDNLENLIEHSEKEKYHEQ